MKSLIDNIATQAIEWCLIASIGELLSPSLVLQMEEELVRTIARESRHKQSLREHTCQELEVLQSGLEICRVHVARKSSGMFCLMYIIPPLLLFSSELTCLNITSALIGQSNSPKSDLPGLAFKLKSTNEDVQPSTEEALKVSNSTPWNLQFLLIHWLLEFYAAWATRINHDTFRAGTGHRNVLRSGSPSKSCFFDVRHYVDFVGYRFVCQVQEEEGFKSGCQ